MKRSLKFWIIVITTLGMMMTLTAVFMTNYYVNRQSLEKIVLKENQSNAKKLSALTNDTFLMMENALKAQHSGVLENWDNPNQLAELTSTLRKSNFNFNTVTVIDAKGYGKANNPDLNLVGNRVDTEGVRTGLRLRKDFISRPYIGPNNRLMMVVSTALYKDGRYYGMVNGLVWLQQRNFLTRLLEETYGNEQRNVSVYDNSGTYIYHSNRDLIGRKAKKNKATIDLADGKTGQSVIEDQTGERFFAGYATVPKSQWGIISMTSEQEALSPANTATTRALLIGTSFVLLALFLLIGLIMFITKPLKELSVLNYRKPINEVVQEVSTLHSPYQEVESIRQMVLSFAKNQQNLIQSLEETALTDPMTGLANRRRLDQLVGLIKENEEVFGYLLLDIDYFKAVNDTYGHLVGDQVLITLADIIREHTPSSGLPIRIGGEEFAIILQDLPMESIFAFAEHLREVIEKSEFPGPQKITVSIGAGYLDCDKCDLDVFYNEVDQQLYKAKHRGRNRVETVWIQKGEKNVS
ncbi:sensor domain-containing diguanylate cyclase [Exiguobacterium sp. S22-S28]|uniref:sensor domain-containing diguanylate cyclase n=1 Tax=Exiguobacterium sp. S22-S28 TaxID=3342768 RepID=UPI00372D2C0D